MSLRLSLLDYAPLDPDTRPEGAMAASVEFAQHADALGYERIWYAEHHGSDSAVSVSPELMMTLAAAKTSRIKVGSGAMLLPNYSSYKVAENYQSMATMFPNRVDVGIGRSTGGGPEISHALRDGRPDGAALPQKVRDLLRYFGRPVNGSGELDYSMVARPVAASAPQPWILGSSGATASMAAHFGTGFTFAHFINSGDQGVAAAQHYRDTFVPSEFFAEPEVIVATFVAVAESEEEAARLAASFHLWLVDIERDVDARLMKPEDAVVREVSLQEARIMRRNEGRIITGTPKEAIGELRSLARKYRTDQVMINTFIPGHHARMSAIELLAQANH